MEIRITYDDGRTFTTQIPNAFAKAPFAVITKAMRLAKISNETMRYICGM